ncbi:MAG: FtsQ-type POTRA domain-containing protein [Lentisphaeria bacterium]|nr:FtsQ-type POTRA domain-containing protein [Lentisphaeria bacterium]
MKKLSELAFFKERSVRIWCAVIALVIALAGSGVLIWLLANEMFLANPRFVLKHVRVTGHQKGFWTDKKDLVCSILRIRENETNLFSIDLGEMRKRLLERESSIRSVRVRRELPDTLDVDITERIPVAQVKDSQLVVDEQTILMQRSRCMKFDPKLPIIVGPPEVSTYPSGSKIPQFKAAVDLIELTKTTYPDIRIGAVKVTRPKQLVCAVYYKNERDPYPVTMPDSDLSRNLQKLTVALEEIRHNHSPKSNIDLQFKDQAVIK